MASWSKTCGDAKAAAASTRRSISSVELMGSGNELIIRHGGEEYRLRITKQEKLILTK